MLVDQFLTCVVAIVFFLALFAVAGARGRNKALVFLSLVTIFLIGFLVGRFLDLSFLAGVFIGCFFVGIALFQRKALQIINSRLGKKD